MAHLTIAALFLLLAAGAMFSVPAAAQLGILPGAATAAEEAKAEPPAKPDPVEALLKVLEDPAARERLVAQLRQQQAAGDDAAEDGGETMATPPAAPPAATEPSLIGLIEQDVTRLTNNLVRFITGATDFNRFWGWTKIQARSAELRGYWTNFLWALAISLAAAFVAFSFVRGLVWRIGARLRARDIDGLQRKVWHFSIVNLLDLLPLLAFGAAGAAALLFASFPRRTDLVGEHVLWTIGTALLTILAAKAVLRPSAPHLRLVRISDEVAEDLFGRIRWIAIWLAAGIAVFENIGRLGIPEGIFEGLARLWGLFIVLLVLAPFFTYRKAISNSISGEAQIRRVLAAIWLPVVFVYTVGTYVIWATDVRDAFGLFARGGVMTLVVLFAVQPVCMGLKQGIRRLETEIQGRFDQAISDRIEKYLPLLQRAAVGVIYLLAAAAIGLAWGFEPVSILGAFSAPVISVVIDIALIFLVVWVIWEVADVAFEVYLKGTVEDSGIKVERSARARTLVPLFRTVLVVLLALGFVGAALSSFGLDIAPLLATAGIAGIAIGFGAQKLVQDVITGLFMLFQNTIRVGDIVELGGIAGTVQRLTIRTIELRDLEGNLYTIPFSSVDTVKNMTREFAFAMIDVGVAYRENADHVMEVLRHLGAELEGDPVHGPNILAAIEVLGVQDLADSAVIIRCRFKVAPQTQWGVRRAFLALVKRRFDELDIEIPFPQRTLHWAQPHEQPAFSTETRTAGADTVKSR